MEYICAMLFVVFCGLAGVVTEIRKVNRQLDEITIAFKNIDESLSKIEKHLERIDDKD